MPTDTTFAPLPPADPAFRPVRAPRFDAPATANGIVPCSEMPTRLDSAGQSALDARRGDADAVGCLPPGTRLREFVIERVLGEGGFGVVYSAYDLALGRRVAIKEYMPAAFAVRRPDHSVQVRSSNEKQAAFAIGLKSFINEARLLGQFDHPAVAKVFQFWNEHGTAYFVMPYYTSPTLSSWLRERGAAPIDEPWLRHYFLTALDALAFLHGKGCLHRDLSPQNMLVVDGTDPLLLDFGAARRVVGEHTASLTAILKPGYAPLEQYDGNTLKQGPWTDLYALAAVMYQAMVGAPPPAAVERVMQSSGRSNALGGSAISEKLAQTHYSRPLIAAVELALALHPRHRPQSADELASLIRAAAPLPASPAAAPNANTRLRTLNLSPPAAIGAAAPIAENSRAAATLIAAATGLVAACAIGLAVWPSAPEVSAATMNPAASTQTTVDDRAAHGRIKPIGDAPSGPANASVEPDRAPVAIEASALADAIPVDAYARPESAPAPAVAAGRTQAAPPSTPPARGKTMASKQKPELRDVSEPAPAMAASAGTPPRPAALALPPLLTAYSPPAEPARAASMATETAANALASEPARDMLRALDRPTPVFPAEALRDGVRQGRVQASFVVNPDGSVSAVRIASAAPARVFDRAVRAALAQWRFAPVATATPATVEFAFDVGR